MSGFNDSDGSMSRSASSSADVHEALDGMSSIYLSKLTSLLEEQVVVLRRIDERQRAGDLSKQPMPEVPATSSSAWNALLKSALSETIQPKVERWRSGLDALLVFLGLFSAIVTSFFVQSLTTLQQDQTVRTNELVANLTDIVIQISGVSPTSLRTAQPKVFHPDPTDVRLNAYWSLSLILSLSIAALAVACRGYLNMVGWSRFTKASEKLIDIRTRWISSERFLGPTIELLPQGLVIPVLLFIAGLLDTLFSSVLQLSPTPKLILFTSGLSLLFISAVAALLGYTLTHRSINPASGSLFQLTAELKKRLSGNRFADGDSLELLSEKAQSVYHEVVQATHDDDTLNEASAALYNILQSFAVWPRYGSSNPGLLEAERATFLHLLSPEASTRSNRTAAQVIMRIHETNRIRYSPKDMSELIPTLLQAARLSPLADLWNSPFIQAMAVVGNAGSFFAHHPPVIAFLSSDYIDSQHLPSDKDPSAEYAVRTKTISFIVEVLFNKLIHSLAESQFCDEDDVVVNILSSLPSISVGNAPTSSSVNPVKIIAALMYLPLPQNVPILTLIIRWLVRMTSPLAVLRATQTHVAATTGHDVWPTILFFIASIAGRVCLAVEGFSQHAALAELCVATLCKIAVFHQFHPQLPVLVATTAAAFESIGKDKVSTKMAQDLLKVRNFVADDTWRWSAKQRSIVLSELESLVPQKMPRTTKSEMDEPEDAERESQTRIASSMSDDAQSESTKDAVSLLTEVDFSGPICSRRSEVAETCYMRGERWWWQGAN